MQKYVLHLKDAKWIVAPKYKELGVKKLWPYIKELEDLAIYFPDMKPDQYPDRDYMWTVISTLRTDVTQKLVKQARDHRSVTREENNEELV